MSKLTEQDQARIAAIEKDLGLLMAYAGLKFPETVDEVRVFEAAHPKKTEPIKEEVKPYVVLEYSEIIGYHLIIQGFDSQEEYYEIADKIKQLLKEL